MVLKAYFSSIRRLRVKTHVHLDMQPKFGIQEMGNCIFKQSTIKNELQ